jgi:hypothetical protein
MRGSRLWQMYREVVCEKNEVRDVSCLVAIENEWMEIFLKDERDWVRLILNILWMAYPVASEDET